MVVNELQGEKIDIVPFSADSPDFVAKALSPAKVKEVRIDEYEGRAEVIVPDYQLSLAIGKEGQNARLAARLTGWRVDIKSETQLAEEESYKSEEWAQGEWVIDPASGEQVWQPADGGDAMSAEEWKHGGPDDPDGDGIPGADEVVAGATAMANDVTESGGPTDAAEIEPEPSAEEQAMHVVTPPDEPADGPEEPEAQA
jgi:N utilization substance protein A